jgi:hypothetical protein
VDENSRHIVLINTLWGSIALYTTTAKKRKRALAATASFKLEPDPMISKM